MQKKGLLRFTRGTWLRGIGTSVAALFLMVASAYGVTTLGANIETDGALSFTGEGASITTGVIPFFGAPATFSGLIFEGGTDSAIGFGADFISMNQTEVEFLEEAGESTPGAIRFYYDDAVTAAYEGRRSTEYLWRMYPMTGSTGFVFEGPSDGNDDTASIQWQASEASNTGTLHIGARFLRNGVSAVPVACLSDDLDGGTPNAKACMMANSTFVLGQDVGSTDIVMAQAGFSKDSASTETITFTNPGAGVLGVTVDGSLGVGGHVSSTGVAITSGTAGTCSTDSGTGTDTRGTATGDCTIGQTVVITFGSAYATAPICVISPATATAVTGAAHVASTTSTMTITATVATAGSATWNYHCIE